MPNLSRKILPQLLLIALAACALGADLQQPTKKNGIDIAFPVGWEVKDGGLGKTIVGALGPKEKDNTGDFQPAISISVEPGNKIDGAAQQNQLVTSMTGYKIVDKPNNITLANNL